ncbi:MAG: hypothetical protein GY810_28085 [Aureispira sp.]|nr:hypothetical protein [Aureispira sp.]
MLSNIRRKNRNKGKPFEVERLLFYYLRKLLNSATKAEQKNWYEQFLEAINGLRKMPSENIPFQFFSYEPWLKSKIKGCSYQETFLKEDADWRLSN